MQTSLAVTALLMGLAGGPHCVAMCGAACAGIGQAAGARKNEALWGFQLGRVLGYSALGAVAGVSMQGFGWLAVQTVALRPVWTLLHVTTFVFGLLLMWKAQQPVWLEQAGRKIWAGARTLAFGRGRGAPVVVGALWTFLPCGLLYSALLVAALAGSAIEGAAVMALFVVGTSVSMMAGPWLFLRLGGGGAGNWGVRLAGLALAASAAWAVWMAYTDVNGLFCAPPS